MLELVEGCIDIDLDQDNSEVIQTPNNIKQKRKKSEAVNKTKIKTTKSNKTSTTVTKIKKKKEPKINQKYDNALFSSRTCLYFIFNCNCNFQQNNLF